MPIVSGGGSSSGGGGGTQLDYVERTTDQTVGAEADYIVGNAVAYSGTRLKIEVFVATNGLSTSSGVILLLYEDATALGRIADSRQGTGGGADSMAMYGVRYRTPAAGTHTYKIRSLLVGAGAVTLNAGAGGNIATYLPAFLRVASA